MFSSVQDFGKWKEDKNDFILWQASAGKNKTKNKCVSHIMRKHKMCWFCSRLDALFINLHMLREILDQPDFHSTPVAGGLLGLCSFFKQQNNQLLTWPQHCPR